MTLTIRNKFDDIEDAVRYAMSRMHWTPEYIGMFDMYPSIDDYEMVRLGCKKYGFRPHNKQQGGVAVQYKCSHLEAQRRFKLMLITRRLLK